MLGQWISAAAWPMTPPSVYGSFHLLFLFFGLGISAARFGWYAATSLYIPCVSFGAWLVFSAVRLLTRRVRTYTA